jgi:acrylyl-CoA reductase (NADPH)
MFNALVVEQPDSNPVCTFKRWGSSHLPNHPILVKVAYSSLNYKDALAVTGRGKILRSFPMVPGIDLAGTVVESEVTDFQSGDTVVLCGGGLGEDYSGGYAQFASVPAEPLIALPEPMSVEEAMACGTAGFTAMLAVLALRDAGIIPSMGHIVVSGASGGLGSIAVAILSRLGYSVTAISGRPQNGDYLLQLGANEILSRNEFLEPAKPLEQQRWAGAIDTVGGPLLAKLLAQINYSGAVASCGLAGGYELNTTVMPFILRGIQLLGINSTYIQHSQRERAWQQLARTLDHAFWKGISQTIGFREIPTYAEKLLAGEVRGRIIVDVNSE